MFMSPLRRLADCRAMTPHSRRLAILSAVGAALAVPAVAAADDCGIEGTYFSGRSALQAAGAGAALGTFAAGSEATGDVRTFAFGAAGAPRETELSSSSDSRLSTPVFLRRADGAAGAVYATAKGIVVAWDGADPRLLVPGITYNDAGDDVLGAAVAADGTLTVAYADPDQLFASDGGPTVHLARFDATGQPVATLDLPERSATTSLATVRDDGTTLVVGSDAKHAYRWAPGATTLQAIALPAAPGRPADDDALLPDGHGGAWLRTGRQVLHVGTADAAVLANLRADTTVVVGAGGNALFGHGASIAVVAPSGKVINNARATGVVKGAGTVSVLAVASGSGAKPAAFLLGQVRRKRRTLTLVRANGTRATITAKAKNFTTDAQLAVLADGSAWAVWQDGHAYFDQNCDAPSVDDQSVQAVRVPRAAKKAAPKALRDAHLTVETSF
jgi:hypothetical protein